MDSAALISGFRNATPCKRLWLGAGALGVFLLTLLIGNHFIASDRSISREMLGHDFLAFYTAGSFVRQGRAHELYQLDAVRDFEQATANAAGLSKNFGPWWNPPFYALLFKPLAALPYGQALDRWRWISVAAVIGAMVILTTMVAKALPSPSSSPSPSPSIAARYAGLVPVLIVISMPFIQAFGHAQNTLISLLLLAGTVALWRGERKFLAGIVGGLLFYKPQLGAVVAAAMVIDLGWTTLAGLSVTGVILLVTTLVVMPGSLGDWLHQLPANIRWMQIDHAYSWDRHVTLKSFWRLLLQGQGAGEPMPLTTFLTWTSVLAIGGCLAWSVFRGSRPYPFDDRSVMRDRLITATITAMPLLMPFYFDYDLLLLAVPATLYAAERLGHPDRILPEDRWLTAGWVGLYLWTMINPAVAAHAHISGSVILLCGVAVCSIRRVNRQEGEAAPLFILRPQRIAMAA